MIDPVADLKAKQGAGARYDAANAPADDLLGARRGTAFLSRKINELDDNALDLGGRRRTIARICYEARAQAEAIAQLRAEKSLAGVRLNASEAEIAQGATLPARALRHLFHHTCVHLNVEWRDLSDAEWSLDLIDGISVASLPRLRARAVWQAALDLGNGARAVDVPEHLRDT